MQCPSCHNVRSPDGGRCGCGADRAGPTALALAKAPPLTPWSPSSPVSSSAPLSPLSVEARLARNLSETFHGALSHPRLARPLQLARTYWPVAAIPAAATVVGVVGVKTSLGLLGSALLWGMSVAAQLLGNM